MPEHDINQETLQLVQETNRLVKKIERHLYWSRIFSALYVVLIITPIILAIIYFPPVIQPFIDRLELLLQTVPTTRR